MRFIKILFIIILSFFIGYSCDLDPDTEGDDSGRTETEGENPEQPEGTDPIKIDPVTITTPQEDIVVNEWSDLKHWNQWLKLFNENNGHYKNAYLKRDFCTKSLYPCEFSQRWSFEPVRRIYLKLTDREGMPLRDVTSKLYKGRNVIWEMKTDVNGEGYLFCNPYMTKCYDGEFSIAFFQGSKARAKFRNITLSTDLDQEIPQIFITDKIRNKNRRNHSLDLLIMMDTTGSMSDELEYLQNHIGQMLINVRMNLEQTITIRLGLVFFRDQGDEYRIKTTAFNADLKKIIAILNEQTAEGGAYRAEPFDDALLEAVMNFNWSSKADARLTLLFLDSPPKEDPKTIRNLQIASYTASAKGIRLIPVAINGINPETEYLLRFLDVLTGGTYIYLTSEHNYVNTNFYLTVDSKEAETLSEMLTAVLLRYIRGE